MGRECHRFPLWLATTARNFSTHGNLLQSAEPITRKLHRPNPSVGPYHVVGMWDRKETGTTRAPSTQLGAGPTLGPDRKGDRANPPESRPGPSTFKSEE